MSKGNNDDNVASWLIKLTCRTAWTLTLIFSVLKLAGLLDWSWWKALAPTLIIVGILLLIVVIAAAVGVFEDY